MNEPVSTELAELEDSRPLAPVFSSVSAFAAAQRMAKLLVASEFVPDAYRGEQNLANAVIALEFANRLNMSPLAVMQNLEVVHGRPSFRSTMLIALVNSCRRFEPLRFEYAGEPETDGRSCMATTNRLDGGARCDGPAVSIKMAKAKGWYSRKGSSWPSMSELMLSYRAATFFSRLYTPDVTLGMHSIDELEDAKAIDGVAERVVVQVAEPVPEYAGPPLSEIEERITTADAEELAICRDLIRSVDGPGDRIHLLRLVSERAAMLNLARAEVSA